jgi:HlyD family secretion protein
MKVFQIVCFLYSLLFISCAGKKVDSLLTFNLTRSDYVEKITVPGTVQAVVNYPVTPSNQSYVQMTIIRLAEDGAYVKKGDTICILSAPELESSYAETRNKLDSLEAGLKKTEADNKLKIALLEAQLAINEAQLQISSLDSLRMLYASEIQQKLLKLEMDRALIEMEKTNKKLTATRLIANNDIKQINARIIQERTKVESVADQVSFLTIISPRDGIVSRTESPEINFFSSQGSGSVGGPIKEGSVLLFETPVLQFPDLSTMQVSAEVAEGDFKKLEKGQKVFITVDAAEKLIITGKVNRKNLIGQNAQRWSESKVKFYEVIIDIDSCHSRMKPGLSASCEITLTEAKDTLFVPTLAIFERDSVKVVYVKKKEHYVSVVVQTGYSGSSYTIIKGGLKGDEVLALAEPPLKLIENGTEKKASHDTLNIHKPKI